VNSGGLHSLLHFFPALFYLAMVDGAWGVAAKSPGTMLAPPRAYAYAMRRVDGSRAGRVGVRGSEGSNFNVAAAAFMRKSGLRKASGEDESARRDRLAGALARRDRVGGKKSLSKSSEAWSPESAAAAVQQSIRSNQDAWDACM
jgi:hypothetical protein|tara:strand:+ start:2908 stop:3339 length:432 start_codon:yes stop_codon:yes gene_type:complete